MTMARYDGAHMAPALRLRGHGALRRALDRVVSTRQADRVAHGHLLPLDDATLATFGRRRDEIEVTGRSLYPL
jgi:hypothetical protein